MQQQMQSEGLANMQMNNGGGMPNFKMGGQIDYGTKGPSDRNNVPRLIMSKILQYLDIRSLLNVKESSLIQQCRKAFGSNDFERVRDAALELDYDKQEVSMR